MSDDTYLIGYKCCNCMAERMARMPKGKTAPGSLLCEECGTQNLIKVNAREIKHFGNIYEVDTKNCVLMKSAS